MGQRQFTIGNRRWKKILYRNRRELRERQERERTRPPLHQHRDAKGNVFGKLHSVHFVHEKPSTYKAHFNSP